VFYIFLAFFVSNVIFGNSTFATLFYLTLAFAVFVFANAFVINPIQPEISNTLPGESFHETNQNWD
jgi:hypothetical protein